MASWIKNMKDGSKRLKDEFVRQISASGEGCMDPVLEYRSQRFNKYNENLEKLSRSMTHYIETSQAHTQASVGLMQAFSTFFEGQFQDASPEDEDYAQTKALAQSAIRLQEIHQSLRANVYDVAHEMQINHVSRSIQQLRKSNAVVQKQLQTLKQRLAEYYSTQRAAETQKKNTPEYEKAQQRVNGMETALVTMTNEINAELNAVEARRSIDMRNELLTVVACQIFTHNRSREHCEQLLPLLPGTAKPLVQVSEYAHGRPRDNPGENDVVGVINYAGQGSHNTAEVPLHFYHKVAAVDPSTVHPLQSTQFGDIHFGEKLAAATYGHHPIQ